MRALPALLRMARLEIDARAAELAELQAQADAITARKAALCSEMAAEQSAARSEIMALRAYAAYAPRAAAQVRSLDEHAAALADQITQALARLSEALAERRKLERLGEILDDRRSRAEAALDQAETDEMAALAAARAGRA